LERSVPWVEITIEQIGNFVSGARFPDLVQRPQNVLAETTTRIRNLLHRDGENFLRNRDSEWSRKNTRKGKGCDIGYALAASSCEGANNVEACTVTALDAITAFAVPNPNCSSQNQSVFSGLAARRVAAFQCKQPVAMDQKPETQPIESLLLNEWEIKFFPVFHRNIHRCSIPWPFF
jgi:hypothetical protein